MKKLIFSIMIIFCIAGCMLPGEKEIDDDSMALTETEVPEKPIEIGIQTVEDGKIKLTWIDKAVNEDGFIIERSTESGNSGFVEITRVPEDREEYTQSGLLLNEEYWYRVIAYNANGNSEFSVAVSIVPVSVSGLPASPSNLTAFVQSESQILVRWTDNSTDEDGFIVERRKTSALQWGEIEQLSTNASEFTDTNLDSDCEYYYRVCAYNSYGRSGYSNADSAVTLEPPTKPAAPTNLLAEATSPDTVELTWWDQSDNESEFKIFADKAVMPNGLVGTNQIVGTVDADTTSFTHEANGMTDANYYVFAVNSAGSSARSNWASAPPVLRIINDLPDDGGTTGWGKYNTIIRLRVGPSQYSVSTNTNTYEHLTPYESVSVDYYLNYAKKIYPNDDQENSYEDFPIADYGFDDGSTYYVYMQCGWWDYVYDFYTGASSYRKNYTNVMVGNIEGQNNKWAIFYVYNHFAGYEVVRASTFLPDYHWPSQ